MRRIIPLSLMAIGLTVPLLVAPLSAKDPAGKKPSQAQLRKAQKQEALQAAIVRANAGDAEAQYLVGMSHLRGKGVAKDPVKGVQMLESAAGQGNKDAQMALIDVYNKGRFGVAKNPARVEELYKQLGIASPAATKAAYDQMKTKLDAALQSDDERARYINRARQLGDDPPLATVASMVIEGTRLMEKAHGQNPVVPRAVAGEGALATTTPR